MRDACESTKQEIAICIPLETTNQLGTTTFCGKAGYNEKPSLVNYIFIKCCNQIK